MTIEQKIKAVAELDDIDENEIRENWSEDEIDMRHFQLMEVEDNI